MKKNENIYKCEICKYTTKRRGNMTTHNSSKKDVDRIIIAQ